MRIQHNIMAMSAYRNYTNNVSAMKKNLEKLSSGYKINRAGDDAAGLAISEKMRAQITGLQTAQKNAKDGISLVQTAEGALTEVHDMLNRMVELATQSANGTYDNSTDRNQLQKEMDQLRSEINRIADSSNFNGIKLLDGSMSSGVTGAAAGNFDLPEVGQVLGTDTVLHNKALTNNGTEFSVELHNLEFHNMKGDNVVIELGEGSNATTIELIAKADATGSTTALSGDGIASAILNGTSSSSTTGYTVKINGTEYKKGDTFQINGQDFTLASSASPANVDGAKLTFVQTNPPVDKSEEVNGAMKVTVSGDIKAVTAKYAVNVTSSMVTAAATGSVIKIGNKSVTLKTGEGTSVAAIASAINNASGVGYTASVGTGTNAGKLILEATTGGKQAKPTFAIQNTTTLTAATGVAGADMENAKVANAVTGATSTTVIAVGVGTNTPKAVTVGSLPASGTKAISLGSTGLKLSVDKDGNVSVLATAAGTAGNNVKFSIATGATSAAAKRALASIGTGTGLTGGSNSAKASATVTITASNNWVTINGEAKQLTFGAAVTTGAGLTIGGYTVTATSNGTVTITAAANTSADNGVLVAVGSSKSAAMEKLYNKTTTGGDNGTKATFTINGAAWTSSAGPLKLTIGTTAVTLAHGATSVGNYNVSATSNGTITLTAKEVGVVAGTALAVDTAASKVSFDTTTTATVDEVRAGVNAGTIKDGPSGDWNVSTTDINNVYAGGHDRLASTYFDLKGKVADGASIKIADETYVFSTNKDTVIASGAIKVDISKLDSKASDYLSKVAKELTDAAANNQVYTVGHDGSRITVTETLDHAGFAAAASTAAPYPADKKWDLSTLDGVKKSLGFSNPGTQGHKLTLQIGDTAEEFNQLKVDIKDCHVYSMGDGETSIADISIADQDSAAKAVEVIKAAINYVSDVRGTLGATQNRLDHTINNLSVMTENIQDAESTIRDVDIAEEMMAYTKNNILIQSAQAMLAQANQVPQGVLQLLG